MRQLLSPLQKVKTVIHIVQALSVFIATCICIAAFVQEGRSDSRLKWFFAMVQNFRPFCINCNLTPSHIVLDYCSSFDISHSGPNVDTRREHCKVPLVRLR
jgi:hypothetical protein